MSPQREPLEQATKYEVAAGFCRDASVRDVLDVGARDQILKTYIHNATTSPPAYVGVDLTNDESTDNIVGDLSLGLPFPDKSFDVVFALDVLEHLDDLEAGLCELTRLSRRKIVFALPNMGYAQSRLKYLVSGSLGSKYDLQETLPNDRHRWVTALPQSEKYVVAFAARNGLTSKTIHLSAGPRRYRVERVLRAARFPSAIYAHSTLFELTTRAG